MDTANFAQQRKTVPGLQGLIVRLFDVMLVVLGALAASQVRFEDLTQSRIDTAFVAFAAASTLVLFPTFGVYGSWRGRAMLRMAGQVSVAWFVVQGFGLVLMFSLHRTDFISRLWFAYWMAMTGGALIVSRLLVHAVLARVRHAGMNLRRVAVVGCGSHCHQVVRNIEGSSASGFRAVAAFDVRPVTGTIGSGVPVYDDIVKFAAYVRSHDVSELWLALPLSEERTISRFVAEFRDDLVNVRFVPDMRSVALFDSGMIDLIGMPAINLVASPVPARALVKKEVFDRAFAACVDCACTSAGGDCGCCEAFFAWTGVLHAEAQRGGRPHLQNLQVPLDASSRRGNGRGETGHARRSTYYACGSVSPANQPG